jgi:hypothetical protein
VIGIKGYPSEFLCELRVFASWLALDIGGRAHIWPPAGWRLPDGVVFSMIIV